MSDDVSHATTSRGDELLQIADVEVYYGPARALAGESITVGRGEIVSLLGGNASGKSTTMKTILGLVRPRAGTVTFAGRDITTWSTARRVRLGIGCVPEARRVFPQLTVEENLLAGAFTRRSRAEVRRSLREMYELFPRLAERRGQAAGTFSGGEQQMLAVARALMSKPQLICMDEPTMGLSPLYVERVLDTIVQINRELGVATLVVEQNAELALSIAHRGYVLRQGEIVLQGDAAQLRRDPLVREAYLGRTVDGGTAGEAARASYA